MLLSRALRVVWCGLPLDLLLGAQAESAGRMGESGSSLMTFPMKVSCRLRMRCSMVGMLLNACLMCSFLM